MTPPKAQLSVLDVEPEPELAELELIPGQWPVEPVGAEVGAVPAGTEAGALPVGAPAEVDGAVVEELELDEPLPAL